MISGCIQSASTRELESGKGMDTMSSGTGVFYQVMPAVGDDGRNIMKLIPVQMVNGHFVRTQISKPKVDSEPQKAFSLNIAQSPGQVVTVSNLISTPPQRIIRTATHSGVNVSSNQAAATRNLGNFVSRNPLPYQTVNQLTKVPQIVPFSKLVRLPDQPPVSVKSTALSHVPRENFIPPTNSSAVSGQPPAYMFPVTTLGPHVTTPTSSAPHFLKQIYAVKNKPTCGPTMPKRSKPNLKLIQKVSQRPNSPVKWIIEEENSSAPPSLNPLNLPFATSQILETVAERENKNMRSKTVTKQTAVCPAIPAKSGLGQENSLVRCNGKIFFMAKKNNPPFEIREEMKMSPLKNSELKEVSTPSNDMKESNSIPPRSDEVIDLCDDDPQTATMSSPDEDNVIFVSYIPPKSKSGSSEDLANPPAEKETTQMGVASSDCVTGEKNRKLIVDTDTNSTNVRGSSAVIMNDDVASHKDCKQSMDHSSRCNETAVEILSMENSTNLPPYLRCPPKLCLMSDHALRQAFGIIADVKICLQRIHVKPARTSERKSGNTHVRKGISRLKGREDSCRDLDMFGDVAPGQISPRLHTEISHNECSHNRLKADTHITINKSPTGQSSHTGIVGDVEEDPGICYMEPLDEDLPSADVKRIPKTQTYTNLNSKLSRVGRTRKRTMCPCCTPSGLDPTVKSNSKLGGPHKQA